MNSCNQKSIYFTKRELDRPNFSSALKPRELLQKNQRHVADRPVALFGDNQLGFSGYLLFSFLVRFVVLGADQQADDIRVLFNRTGLAEVAGGVVFHCRAALVAGSIERSR